MLAPVKDASRRYRGGQEAILDRPCARRPAGWQVGTKGWPIRSNKGMDLGGLHNPGYANHPTQNPANSTYSVEEAPDLPSFAAAYGYGLARNHPFVDGNKRTALVVVELFLALNGLRLTANDEACVLVILEVAVGSRSEAAFAAWIRAHAAGLEQ